ncbi:hypothetical protein LTR53_006846 [Teratosphaeriaceae sp. CCFEE 6253]|nr:hypothetical protein LTR53_006846 [Teratosphaeriaceae sp. CCFEE 6253]
MALDPPCPLPSVAEALLPYIRSRDEASQIRRKLQGHLQRQSGNGGTILSPVSLVSPREGAISSAGPGMTGVRQAYLEALQAHSDAQAKYDTLKAELAQLSPAATSSDMPLSAGLSGVNNTLVPLLRQRERQRRLQVIDRTYSDITAVGRDAIDVHLDEIAAQQAGHPPTPPTSQPAALGDKSSSDGRILQLKKAVIVTKRIVDARETASTAESALPKSGPGSETAGLQSALNELTGWMEQQLAIIGDGANDDAATPSNPRTTTGEETPGTTASLDDLAALYAEYIAARQALLQTIADGPASDRPQAAPTYSNSPPTTVPPQPHLSSAEILLPFLGPLATARGQTHSLQTQSSFLRRQLATAETSTHRLLARLADESHLVHPGANKGADWADAAADAGRETAAVKEGERFAAQAEEVLGQIEEGPGMLAEVTAAVS